MLAPLITLGVILLAALALIAAASRHKKSARVPLELVGRAGTVEKDLTPVGAVLVGGELMPARSRTGQKILRAECPRVRVVGASGHLLEVEPEGETMK